MMLQSSLLNSHPVNVKDTPSEELTDGLRFSFPEAFIAELERFRIHNSLTTSSLGHQSPHCCHQCFKAHLLKSAAHFGFSKAVIISLEKMLPCETGHHDYYLDQEELLHI